MSEVYMVMGNYAPHRYSLVRVTDEGGREIVRSSPSTHHGVNGAVQRAQQAFCRELREENAASEGVPNSRYGAWETPEDVVEQWDEVSEEARMDYLHEDALEWKQREESRRATLAPIESLDFEEPKTVGGPEPKSEDIVQRFEATHEDGETYTGTIKSLFDAGTIVVFERYDRAAWAVEQEGDGLTTPEKEVADAVRQESDIPQGVRM